MSETERNPFEYYYQHSKPEDEPHLQSEEALSVESFRAEFQDEGGNISLEYGPYNYRLKYEPVKTQVEADLLAINLPRNTPHRFFRINELVLVDTRDENATLTFSTVKPADVELFFTDSVIKNPVSSYITNKVTGIKAVSLALPPTSPKALLILLHEIGHYHDFRDSEVQETIGKKRFRDDLGYGPERKAAAVLIKERNSWAWALKKLKPFLDRNAQGVSDQALFPKREVLDYAKKYCLWTYQHNLRNQVNQEHRINWELMSEIDWWESDYGQFYDEEVGELEKEVEETPGT